MKNNIIFILAIIYPIILFSCKKQEKNTILIFVPEESRLNTEEGFENDSIVITPYNCDSFLFLQYDNGDIFYGNVFVKKNNVVIEKYPILSTAVIPGKIVGYDSIVTFAQRDTAFFHQSKMHFIPKGMGYFMADCNYVIKQLDEGYVTIKQSVIDTTFRELYFYDKNYNIYKYILTSSCNMYVYNKKI